jgi:hypothetical protein
MKNATIQQHMTIVLCRAISGGMSKLSRSLLPVLAFPFATSVLFPTKFPALFSLSAARQARARCSKVRVNTVKARDHGNSLEGAGHCRASHIAQTRKETIPTLNRTSTFFRDNNCSPIFTRAPSNFSAYHKKERLIRSEESPGRPASRKIPAREFHRR